MTPEAQRIARHHLGDALTTLMRGGPHAADWIVFARHGATEVSARAPTVEEAASNAADQLRAAGWVPTHPRLEWRVDGRESELHFCIDGYAPALFSLIAWDAGEYSMYVYHTPDEDVDMCGPLADAIATISEWCATNLPSLHLPPFPGASDAS